MSLFDPDDPEPESADVVHLVTELRQVNDRPVLFTACGKSGPPRTPVAPTGLRTTRWPSFATCAACVSS